MGENALYATSTFSIMRLICPLPPPAPPQKLHNLCLSFLLGITAVSRQIENIAYIKFLGANKVIMGNVEVAYGRIALAVAKSLIVFSGCGIFLA